MYITVPLVKLIPLWLIDLQLTGHKPSTIRTYKQRVKPFLSEDLPPTRAVYEQYFGEKRKQVDAHKLDSHTFNFEVSTLNTFFAWLVDNVLIEEHPNPDYQPRREKGNAKKS